MSLKKLLPLALIATIASTLSTPFAYGSETDLGSCPTSCNNGHTLKGQNCFSVTNRSTSNIDVNVLVANSGGTLVPATVPCSRGDLGSNKTMIIILEPGTKYFVANGNTPALATQINNESGHYSMKLSNDKIVMTSTKP